MRSTLRALSTATLLGMLSAMPLSLLFGQQRLDLGVQLSPQLMFVHGEERSDFEEGVMSYTEGGTGFDLGFTVGAYLEYELAARVSLRAGVNVARRRYRYPVTEYQADGTPIRSGTNRIVYMAIEVPVSLIYHFDYLRNNDRVLIGAGGVAARWAGIPQLETINYRGSSSSAPIEYRAYSLHVFTAYDHYIADRFVLGLEPFVSYAPGGDVLMLESRTVAVADLEFGVNLRVRFDN